MFLHDLLECHITFGWRGMRQKTRNTPQPAVIHGNEMSQPINQHWVPQFYLRHFATPETQASKNPKVWVFSKDKRDGDPLLTNIRNICAKRYLYSPISADGQHEWELESKLHDLESMLAPMWPSLADGYVDLMEHESIRKAIALFVSVMYLRHPDGLEEVTQIHRQLVQIYEEAPKKVNDTPYIDWIQINGETHEVDTSGWNEYRDWGRNDHHRFFTDMVHSHSIFLAELFLKKRWSVIFSDISAFVTSDKPVAKQHQKKEKFGFGTAGTIISFPLSPTRLLVMDDMHHEPAGQYYPLHNNDPGPFNLLIWKNGSRFMISQRSIDEVLLEIVRWADQYEKGSV